MMSRISKISVKKPIAVIFFLGVGLVLAFYGMSQIESERDEDLWLPEETPVVKADNIIKDEFVKYGHTMILVHADDIRTHEVLGTMAEIEGGSGERATCSCGHEHCQFAQSCARRKERNRT